jgi:hypothetical protein
MLFCPDEQVQLEQFLNIIGTKLDPHILKYDRHDKHANSPFHASSSKENVRQVIKRRNYNFFLGSLT